jgi:DNA polymerase elongation subunit (family B)
MKAANDDPRILVLDIETRLIPVLTFGIRDQHIAVNQIVDIEESARLIHCVGLKWLGERKVTVLTEWGDGYSEMLRQTRDMLDEADAVIGFNHENFDLKKMNGQFALEGIDFPKPPTPIDLFKTVRKWSFPSAKLDYIAQAFGIGSKIKHSGFDLWRDVRDGCPKAQRKMAKYCAGDVRLTEALYERIKPYITDHPRIGVRHGLTCPNCGGEHLTRQGWKITRTTRVQSLKCGSCGSWTQGKRERIAA